MRRLKVPDRFVAMQAEEFAVLWSNGNPWCREAERQLAIHGIIAKIIPFPPLSVENCDYEPLLLVNGSTYKGVDDIRYYCECVDAHPELAGRQIGYSVPEPCGIKRRKDWEPAWAPPRTQ
jgi:hypothetical protein